MASIHVGVGGWTFAPWRGEFFPADLPHARELEYAASQLTSIEINGTFYRHQTAATFASWRDQTPDGFVFSVKAHRATTNLRNLAEAGPSIERFLDSGITELGAKLGAILWQFPPTRKFDPETIEPFLTMLPPGQDGLALRHAVEARHPSFCDAAYMALLRKYKIAHAIIDSPKQTLLADLTADFFYARLERNSLAEPEGYDSGELDLWAKRFRAWSTGQKSPTTPTATSGDTPRPRNGYVYFISGDKVRAPRAAQAMIRRLKQSKVKRPGKRFPPDPSTIRLGRRAA